MSAPLSIRFNDEVLARLRARARALPGATPSGLAQQMVDEGLRMSEYPGVVFRDGPAGRRAALAAGPDIREIITVIREVDERGPAAVAAAAEILSLPKGSVHLAMGYYSAHAAGIDAEIAAHEAESAAAEAAWDEQQRLLA